MKVFVRVPFLALLLVVSAGSFVVGGFFQERGYFPMRELQRLRQGYIAKAKAADGGPVDQFGRLRKFPGKTEIECPQQTARTLVLLVAGQSNAANHHGQRYSFNDQRIINFADGRCYVAASPLLGAEGDYGESWTLLGKKLIDRNLADQVILIPAGVGLSDVSRWAAGGDLHDMLQRVVQEATATYKVTHVLWHQGEADFQNGTSTDDYKRKLVSLIDDLRAWESGAKIFISIASYGQSYRGWQPVNPVTSAQKAIIAEKLALAGPDTDDDIGPIDRYDGTHFSASGQEKFADAWANLIAQSGSSVSAMADADD